MDDEKFDRQKRIANWNQGAARNGKVLVAGAGALGNEVMKLLLQLGVGNITVVDFDVVDKANLNRCVFFSEKDAEGKKLKAEVLAEKGKEMNPEAKISVVISRIEDMGDEFFKGYDCAFGCLDNLSARLHLNAHCYGNIPLVDGGTTGFFGKVQVVKGESSCLECSMSRNDYKLLWKKYSCVGEMLDFLDPKMPALSTTTSIVASVQVNEFLKIVMPELKEGENLVGKYAMIDGLRNTMKIFGIEKRKNCAVHGY